MPTKFRISGRIKDLLSDNLRRDTIISKMQAVHTQISGISKEQVTGLLALGLILFIAGALRLMPVRWGFFLSEFDPYFQYRMAEYVSKNGYGAWFSWHDSMSWYPFGRDIFKTAFPALSFTANMLHGFLRAIGVDVTLFQICVVFPIFMGILTCLAVYAFGKELWSKSVGLFAALFIAINGSHIGRTSLGFFDDETIGVFSTITIFWLFLRSISPQRSMKSCVFHSVLAGSMLAYLTWGWGAFRYPMALLCVFTVALIVLRRYSKRLLISFAITYAIQLIAAPQLPYLGVRFLAEWTTLPVYGVLVMLLGLEFSTRLRTTRQKVFALLGIGGATLLIFVILSLQGIATPLVQKFVAVIDPTRRLAMPLVESVAEHRPATWASFFYENGIILFLGVFGLIFPIQRLRNGDLLLVLFSITAIYFASSLVRLTLILAPAIALLAAITMVELAKPAADIVRQAVIFPRRKVRFAPRVGPEFGVAIMFILILVLLPTLAQATKAAYNPTTIATSSFPTIPKEGSERNYQDWLEALAWMRVNLPPESVVLSWWDYGYWITVLGEKRTLADNGTINSTQIGVIARMFMLNETMSAPIMKKYSVTHVAVFAPYEKSQQNEVKFYGVGEDSKWYWMTKICNDTIYDGTRIVMREIREENKVSYYRRLYEGKNLIGNELIADSQGIRSNSVVGELVMRNVGAYKEESEYFDQAFVTKSSWVGVYKVIYPDPSYVSCSLSADKIVYNKTVVSISGKIYGDKIIGGDLRVRLQSSKDAGQTWQDITEVVSDENGSYSYKWSPGAGSYSVRARWDGIPKKFMSAVSPLTKVDVEKARVNIAAELSSMTAPAKSTITISCTLNPPIQGGTFQVEYSLDNRTWTSVEYSSVVAGKAVIGWTPQNSGTYYVRINYVGTDNEYPVAPIYYIVRIT